MESKFLDQDVDVVSLANKGIVIGCFVGRNYNKIIMETGKLTDNIRVTKNGLGKYSFIVDFTAENAPTMERYPEMLELTRPIQNVQPPKLVKNGNER